MDVVFIMIDCFTFDKRVVLPDFIELNLEVSKNSLIEYLSTVFAYEHQMVFAMIYAVA